MNYDHKLYCHLFIVHSVLRNIIDDAFTNVISKTNYSNCVQNDLNLIT